MQLQSLSQILAPRPFIGKFANSYTREWSVWQPEMECGLGWSPRVGERVGDQPGHCCGTACPGASDGTVTRVAQQGPWGRLASALGGLGLVWVT